MRITTKTTTFLIVAIAIVVILQSCLVMDNTYSKVAPGMWRAVLELDPKEKIGKPGEAREDIENIKFSSVTDGELPFNFEVIYTNDSTFYLEIINGSERIKLTDIKTGWDIRTGKDTMFIDIPIYESYISAAYEEKVIAGKWVVKTRKDYSIPFLAKQGKAHRFTLLKKKPLTDISGKWETTFDFDSEEPYKAIGEFKQDGNHLEGTFITETGDYRFLEGTIQEDKMYLSCFDGSHAFLFEAKLSDENNLIGSFRSGNHYKSVWSAKRNDDFELVDPEELTYLKEGYDQMTFSFENSDGKMVSIEDEQYKNKVKIVQILGTWCPNCRDETEFLIAYKKNNPDTDLEIIALAFEKHRDIAKARNAVNIYKNKFGIDYEMLIAGYANKQEAAEKLPMLNHVMSYPTMIFVDKKNTVRKIHTGFYGPATSEFKPFKKEFYDFVSQLLAE